MGRNQSYHCVLLLHEGFIAIDSINDELTYATYSSELPDYTTSVGEIPSPCQAMYYDEKRILIVSENDSVIYVYNTETGK